MGCAFDSFSKSWIDRSYIMVLLVLCYVLPTTTNWVCYLAMVFRFRNSDYKYITVTRKRNSSYPMVNYHKRVGNLFNETFLSFLIYITIRFIYVGLNIK